VVEVELEEQEVVHSLVQYEEEVVEEENDEV